MVQRSKRHLKCSLCYSPCSLRSNKALLHYQPWPLELLRQVSRPRRRQWACLLVQGPPLHRCRLKQRALVHCPRAWPWEGLSNVLGEAQTKTASSPQILSRLKTMQLAVLEGRA
jgi:hypothetical protein